MEDYDHQKDSKLEHYVEVSAYCIRTSMHIYESSLLAVTLRFPYLPWTDLSQAPPGSRSWTRWMILHRQPVKITSKIEATVVAFSEERPMDSGMQDAQFSPLLLVWLSWCGTSVLKMKFRKMQRQSNYLRRRPAIKASSKFYHGWIRNLQITVHVEHLHNITLSSRTSPHKCKRLQICMFREACHPCPPSCGWSMSDDESG